MLFYLYRVKFRLLSKQAHCWSYRRERGRQKLGAGFRRRTIPKFPEGQIPEQKKAASLKILSGVFEDTGAIAARRWCQQCWLPSFHLSWLHRRRGNCNHSILICVSWKSTLSLSTVSWFYTLTVKARKQCQIPSDVRQSWGWQIRQLWHEQHPSRRFNACPVEFSPLSVWTSTNQSLSL